MKYKAIKRFQFGDIVIFEEGDIVEINNYEIKNSYRKTNYSSINREEFDNLVSTSLIPCEKPDNVNHPSHYTWLKEKCGIEVIDITRRLDFDTGNAVKYLLRAGYKTEEGMTDKEKTIEDLKKAIFYINDRIKYIENGD